MTKARTLAVKRPSTPNPRDIVCPHKHFKFETIDRGILSREQHMNLLCTPKGYRWIVKKINPSTMKSADEDLNNNPCRLVKKKPGKTHVHNILAEIWDLLTPEMVGRVKEMLMAEFGLSEKEALDFVCHSRYDTILTANRVAQGNMVGKILDDSVDQPPEGVGIPWLIDAPESQKNVSNIGVNPRLIKEFSKAISSIVSEYVAAMMSARRDSKQRMIAEVILKGFCDLTGEETTLEDPKNRLHRILTLTSDRLALWLRQNMDDDEKKRAKKRRREDQQIRRKIRAKKQERINRQKEKDKLCKENREMKSSQHDQDQLNKQNKSELKKSHKEKRSNIKEDDEGRKAQKDTRNNSKMQENPLKEVEKEKRHQEMEKFREEQKKKQKDEAMMKKSKEELGAAKSEKDRRSSSKTVPFQQPLKRDSNVAASKLAKNTTSNSIHPSTTSQSSAGMSPFAENVDREKQEIGEKETISNSNIRKQGLLSSSQASASKLVDWSNEQIKKASSAFLGSTDKLTLNQSNASYKLAEIFSKGKSSTAFTVDFTHNKLAKPGILRVVSSNDGISEGASTLGKRTQQENSLDKLASDRTHGKLSAESSSLQKFGSVGSQRWKKSLLTVKKTSAGTVEVRETSYSEAKRKIGEVKRESVHLPPEEPFDPDDPRSWAIWSDYATRMIEDWAHWIDKTIQDTEDKAITYQAKNKEGKTSPEDVEEWNRFVKKTNQDAVRWRRRMQKTILETKKEQKQR